MYTYIYHVYIQVWHLITQKSKRKSTTQIKAVGALVCRNKLRKSQTFAFAAKNFVVFFSHQVLFCKSAIKRWNGYIC